MTTNTCREFREDWIDASGAPTAEGVDHARACATCRAALAVHAEVWSLLLDAAPSVEEVPPGFRSRVLARIELAERATSRTRARNWRIVPIVAAACLLAALWPRLHSEPARSHPLGNGASPGATAAIGQALLDEPPPEVLANLDLYENLDYIEEKGADLDRLEAYALGAGEADLPDSDEGWQE